MEYQQKIKGFDKACASQWGSWKCFRHGTYVDGAESSRVFLGGAQDGEIRLSVWCQILVQNKSVGSRGLLRLKSPPRNKNSRGPVPCPSNCVNSSAASVRAKLPQRR